MSGMSSMLLIVLDREARSRHDLNERGTAFRDGGIPSGRSPFSFRSLREGYDRSGWILRMSLMPLMRTTPPFWMAVRPA